MCTVFFCFASFWLYHEYQVDSGDLFTHVFQDYFIDVVTPPPHPPPPPPPTPPPTPTHPTPHPTPPPTHPHPHPRQNGRHFADDILNVFSWMKSCAFWFEFHWNLFLRANGQYFRIGSGNGLTPNRRQAITWSNTGPVHSRIYAAREVDELIAK